MMSSRSVIWTLTEQPPRPSSEFLWDLVQDLQKKVDKDRAGGADRFMIADRIIQVSGFDVDQPAKLVPPAESEYGDQFLDALVNLEGAPPRRRRGGTPVRQRIDPEFVHAALTQWVSGDRSRLQLLQTSPVIERLARNGFLTDATRQQFVIPPDSWRPQVPRDFCDDGKNGLDLGLGDDLKNARKVCYGVFRANQFPVGALGATDPSNWHDRFPQFWLRSDVVVTDERPPENGCSYQAGLLVEEVNLPNFTEPFGPVRLNFVRRTATDKTWSLLTYKLADQDELKINQGWYLVQRRLGGPSAAIMVKMIEFDGNNDWLDSVCETGLLEGAYELLGLDQSTGGAKTGSEPGPAEQGDGAEAGQGGLDGVFTGAFGDYLDECRGRWEDFGRESVSGIKGGLAEFESNPLRFGWVDEVFRVIDRSTSFLSTSTSNWVNVVQQTIPDVVARADEVAAERAGNTVGTASASSTAAGTGSTPADPAVTAAYAVAAGWKTALGIYKVGYDLSRAMLQFLGPGISEGDTTIVEGLNNLARSGNLAQFLQDHDVTEVAAASRKLLTTAPRARNLAEFDADFDSVLRVYGAKYTPEDRRIFSNDVWNAGRSRGRTAGP